MTKDLQPSGSKNIFKFVLMALLLLSFILSSLFLYHGPDEKEQFIKLWFTDLDQLQKANKLPKGWNDIKSINFITGTDTRTKSWLPSLVPPISTTPKGKFKLDVLLLSFVENDSIGVLVQYDLIELESNNIEWELARTYFLTEPAPL